MSRSSGFWEGKRVLVTGATGIVGSWVVKDLVERSAEVVALVLDVNPQSDLRASEGGGRRLKHRIETG
jgi:CDP-glucose 4,6-dehydratase